MLESTYHAALDELMGRVPYDVALPADWNGLATGQAIIPDDQRQYARRYVRQPAVMEITSPLKCASRPRGPLGVYIKDVSRGGMGLLYSQQLFPLEELRIWTSLGKCVLEVARCRKLSPRCYEVGARVLGEPLSPKYLTSL